LKKNNSLKRKTRAAQIAKAEKNNPETNTNRAFKKKAKNIAARQRENAKNIAARQRQNAIESNIKRYIEERMNALIRIRIEMIDLNEKDGDRTLKDELNNLYEKYSMEVVEAQRQLNSMPIYI